ncbi:MAG TPA: arginase family protein, partial [Longimicrobiales bacterium]
MPQLEGRVSGVLRAPEALRAAGLHERLDASYAGTAAPPPYIADRDAVTGLRNVVGIAQYSLDLADALGPLLESDAFPLVLGGDCSILLGVALALRRRGRYGLVYIDAHPDYLTVEQTQTGGVAGLPLAIVTGLGPDELTSLEHRRPYIDAHDAVSVASRDDYQIRASSSGELRVEDSAIRAFPLDAIRRESARAVAAS